MRKVILKVGGNGHSALPDWMKKSLNHLKVNAINEAHAAFKASHKSGTKKPCWGKFRSIRDRIQSIKFRVEDFLVS
ncbi:MAG: hypothetical protein MGG11_05295 [Trichodesmium sp. MAG_R03]|nr:hypothetical protein [Trichodesmium sp. MAG_R03]